MVLRRRHNKILKLTKGQRCRGFVPSRERSHAQVALLPPRSPQQKTTSAGCGLPALTPRANGITAACSAAEVANIDLDRKAPTICCAILAFARLLRSPGCRRTLTI
jgi:hypothetical protein